MILTTRRGYKNLAFEWRLVCVLILVGSVAALLTTQAAAQSTVSYTSGQTDASGYSVTSPTTLTIVSGSAMQSGILTGTGSIFKTGAGTLTLAGGNNFNGNTTVNAGQLIVASSGSISTTSTTTVESNGTLTIAAGSLSGPELSE